ncbi:hypothetical protein V6N13_105211 [Hibiscus sabdariffa]|uniref:Uncharacterized protein n=2 Tax=Hibiscus sabdariffa TaxID=183260 RepID=A0ABR2A373_9ROSI
MERLRFNKDGIALQLFTVIIPNDPDFIDILAMNDVDISISEGYSDDSSSSVGLKVVLVAPTILTGPWILDDPNPNSRMCPPLLMLLELTRQI